MNRFSISLVMAAALLCIYASRVTYAAEVKCEGTIAKIDGEKVTVKAATEQHILTVGPATKITVDGKPSKSSDLKVGQKVKCTASKEGKKLTCTSIEATKAG